ncbi:Hypothetical predicted protein [Cloeon dipterum]|uniref:PSI domain-containing protein n=1 Tax=Cloeon dipterum TaxID=197152 RepID=A0A8S1CW02_9INSE|nr:Hypothetical predicted protein [Cloeon dipterum]
MLIFLTGFKVQCLYAFEVIRRAKKMAHIPQLFGIVISFLVMCRVSSLDNFEDEAPKILYDSNENYFHIRAVRDVNLANSLWVNMDSIEKPSFDRVYQPSYDEKLATITRYLESLQLSFYFPFYGYFTEFVTLDVDGRIFMKKMLDYNEQCNSFVAPLATKLSFHREGSYIKYNDTGKSFVVQWGNVDLLFRNEEQNLNMQVTLYENGTIQFVYKQISTSVFALLRDGLIKDVTIGTSDSVEYDGNHSFPYGVIALRNRINKDFDIKNGTVIVMSPLTTCNWFTSCELCAQIRTDNFNCVWCPQLNRCSNYGIDRGVND